MKVFISWSGILGKAVAQLLNAWLPDVIQGVQTWISVEDIDKGSIWFGDINAALESTNVGILCVTRESKNAPWLLFEAGALSKGLTKSRVCPLLIDLQTKDLLPPLSLFNLTLPDQEDMWKLMRTINAAGGEEALPEDRLRKAYDRWWPDFERGLASIRKEYKPPAPVPARATDDMIVEILEISRAVQRNIEKLGPGTLGTGMLPLSGHGENPKFIWEYPSSSIKFWKPEQKIEASSKDILEMLETLRKVSEVKLGDKKPEGKSTEPAQKLAEGEKPAQD